MNKSLFLYFILVSIFCSLTSCDVWHRVHGTVLDSETNKPIQEVRIFINNGRSSTTTDSIGYFNIMKRENQAFKKTKNICTEVRIEQEG